jgi:hypothetical protein
MKIANRRIILLSWMLGTFAGVAPVWAEPPASAPAAVTSPAALPPAEMALPVPAAPTTIASAAIGETNPGVKIPDLSGALPINKKDPKDDTPEIKIPDSVSDVIKHLSAKKEDITLDDLNAAREAIAKLDALIDIEKRLQDLDKIRDERNKEKEKQLVDAIPKTALAPPPSYMPPPPTREGPPRAMPVPMSMIDVVRIEGSNGRYGALVKDGDAVRLVHVGDHLSDGSVVVAVTTQGVEFARDDKTHLAQVKDVQAVFGDSP